MTDQLPRRFQLVRDIDETGTSGTGVVVEGLEFTDGTVALRWLTATTSTAIYASIADVETIHGHGGKTRVEWVDDQGAEAVVARVRAVLDDPVSLGWRQRIGVAIQGAPCRAGSNAPNAVGTERCALLAGHAGRHADGTLTWPAHDRPSIAELAANDRNWDVEKNGE